MSGKSIPSASARQYPIGAEVLESDEVAFRVWAPERKRAAVIIEDARGTQEFELTSEGNGYFSGVRARTPVGTLYSFRLDNEPRLYPDPASRYQPRGHEGPSEIVAPSRYRWNDADWRGIGRTGHVLYEM